MSNVSLLIGDIKFDIEPITIQSCYDNKGPLVEMVFDRQKLLGAIDKPSLPWGSFIRLAEAPTYVAVSVYTRYDPPGSAKGTVTLSFRATKTTPKKENPWKVFWRTLIENPWPIPEEAYLEKEEKK